MNSYVLTIKCKKCGHILWQDHFDMDEDDRTITVEPCEVCADSVDVPAPLPPESLLPHESLFKRTVESRDPGNAPFEPDWTALGPDGKEQIKNHDAHRVNKEEYEKFFGPARPAPPPSLKLRVLHTPMGDITTLDQGDDFDYGHPTVRVYEPGIEELYRSMLSAYIISEVLYGRGPKEEPDEHKNPSA